MSSINQEDIPNVKEKVIKIIQEVFDLSIDERILSVSDLIQRQNQKMIVMTFSIFLKLLVQFPLTFLNKFYLLQISQISKKILLIYY